jgi:bacterioferritin
MIDDAEVVGVLKHILDEEKRHRKEFRIRLEKISQ